MSALPALEIQDLTLAYGRRVVLPRLSLRVPPGCVYALLGRNGAGKSSLVRALCGLEPLSSGSIRLQGMDLFRQRVKALSQIGVVPERPEVPPGMTAAQASRFCGRLSETWDGDAFEARLKQLAIPLTLPFGALSRGQQTQVAMGLALASRPGILILDDPTLGLDPEARLLFYRNLVEELESRPITVFLTTHDLQGVEGLADRVGLLQEGRLLLDEPLESLKARFRKLQGPPNLSLESLANLGAWGLVQNAFGTEAILTRFSEARASEAGLDPQGLRGASLEDIFLATLNPEARP